MSTAVIEPPAFGARATSLSELTGEWWVAQARPQYERKLALELAAAGHDYYLPTYSVILVKGGKRRRERRLCIPGYVFVNGNANSRYAAACSRHTLRIINVSHQARLAKELSRLDASIMELPVFDTTAFAHKGARVRVKMGHALEGTVGYIDARTGRGTVTVAVTMLGTGTPIEIDPVWLEPED